MKWLEYLGIHVGVSGENHVVSIIAQHGLPRGSIEAILDLESSETIVKSKIAHLIQ